MGELWWNYDVIMVHLYCNYSAIMVSMRSTDTDRTIWCDTNIFVERRKVSEVAEQGKLAFGIDYNYS